MELCESRAYSTSFCFYSAHSHIIPGSSLVALDGYFYAENARIKKIITYLLRLREGGTGKKEFHNPFSHVTLPAAEVECTSPNTRILSLSHSGSRNKPQGGRASGRTARIGSVSLSLSLSLSLWFYFL